MPLWTLNGPPAFAPNAVATDQGWVDPDTGEIFVAIGKLTTKAGPGDVLSVAFDATSYAQGDPISVTVRFNERVNVPAGATLTLSNTGPLGPITLTALQQLNTNEAVFSGTVPLESEEVTLAVTSPLTGAIQDATDNTATNLVVPVSAITAAGTRIIPLVEVSIEDVQFVQASLQQNDPVSVAVTFSEEVDASAGATLQLTTDGTLGPIILTASQQLNTTEVVFAGTVPAESAELSIDAQSISGTIVRTANTAQSAILTITAALAQGAGTRVVP
jgi:hypothetical protein